ncbi:MAG TPA: hypothetical protein PKD72_16490, partial [Gemmatales bacterium]|nr:hypothetical protein [Gemmatales bacterium]
VSQALRTAESLRAEAEAYYHRKLAQATSEANSFRALVKSFPRTEPAASAALLQLYLQEIQPIFSRMQIRTLSDQGVEQIVTFPK